MSTIKKLQDQLRVLRAENRQLRTRPTTFFTRIAEQSDATKQLNKNNVPYFVEQPKTAFIKDNNPTCYLFSGDNLAVLTGLGYVYDNKVDIIYVDPPYNTGKSIYTYEDKYDNGTTIDKHAIWLSFMETRLVLGKNMLRDTGVIMVAVGLDELAHLKLLMDEIFGEENFVSNIAVEGTMKNNAKLISNSNDYMLVYAKNCAELKKLGVTWRTSKIAAKSLLAKAENIWENTGDSKTATAEIRKYFRSSDAREFFTSEPGLKMYNNIDENGDLYRAGDLSSPSNNGGVYDVINPHTGCVVTRPVRGWVHAEKTFQKMIEENTILWNGNNVPAYKRYLKHNLSVVKKDFIKRDGDAPNKTLQRLIGRNKFTFPKDHNMLADWIEYVTPQHRKNDSNDPIIVMDFFAGSGSTGHAVALLNSYDNGNRETILVTSPENSIPTDVMYPRMKALLSGTWADGTHAPLRGSLKFFTTKFSSARVEPKTMWSFIPYSENYVNYVRSLIQHFKDNRLL